MLIAELPSTLLDTRIWRSSMPNSWIDIRRDLSGSPNHSESYWIKSCRISQILGSSIKLFRFPISNILCYLSISLHQMQSYPIALDSAKQSRSQLTQPSITLSSITFSLPLWYTTFDCFLYSFLSPETFTGSRKFHAVLSNLWPQFHSLDDCTLVSKLHCSVE